ncbi:MAG: 50S ribosomal protein L32 [Sandaracinaceae bacterium]|nr:50S ribosomal protein L32 [Sandaracinaceae bacterium]
MAVPKRRNPRARRNSRRANHDKVSAPNIIECPNCGELMLPTAFCPLLRPLQRPRGGGDRRRDDGVAREGPCST